MSELLRKSEENLKSLQGAYLAALDEIQALGEAEALRKETEEKMAEMKAQEEEKNREMERLKQESLKMEEEKAALERQMDEMNAKYMADVKQLNELGSQKRYYFEFCVFAPHLIMKIGSWKLKSTCFDLDWTSMTKVKLI